MPAALVLPLLAGLGHRTQSQTLPPRAFVAVKGESIVENGETLIRSPSARFIIGKPDSANYRLDFQARLVTVPSTFNLVLVVAPKDPEDETSPAPLRLGLLGDNDGRLLVAYSSKVDATGASAYDWISYLNYWPGQEEVARRAAAAGIARRSWKDRWVSVRVEVGSRHSTAWVEGMMVSRSRRPAPSRGPIMLVLFAGDRVRNVAVQPYRDDTLFETLDLAPHANAHFARPVGKDLLEVAGVPFELPPGPADHLSLRHARWPDRKIGENGYQEPYDAGPSLLHDPRMPLLRVPAEDYVAAHVLAVADDEPQTTSAFTMRAGRYGDGGQVRSYDFGARAPRRSELSRIQGGGKVETPAGPLAHLCVPWPIAFAQDMDQCIEVELTKEVRLARRRPDPSRFRYRPLGLPSSVRIAAITLERSPLPMKITGALPGNVFVEPHAPTFNVHLENILSTEQTYTLIAEATHDGRTTRVGIGGKVAPRAAVDRAIPIKGADRGYSDLTIRLLDGNQQPLLERHELRRPPTR